MASGDTLLVLAPYDGEPPAANFAQLDQRNVAPVLDFDDTTGESIEFGGVLPRNYGGGGVTVTIGWMATSAVTGSVVWGVSFKSFSDDADDLDSKAFAASNNATAPAASASGEIVYDTIAFTDGADMDSVAAAEYFRLKLERLPADGSDDMVGDAELISLEIKET